MNAFTVDVEDYFQVASFEDVIKRDDWDSCESRVVANTQRLLRLLQRHEVRATFFVLGWVADRFPSLVREIDQAGHEIGSHSFWHRRIYEQTPDEFREDLRRSRDVLQEILGRRITAYRAPTFSVTQKSLWAIDILAEEGFRYDSSIFPTHHDRYGIPDAEPGIHRWERAAGTVYEFPPTIRRLMGQHLPVAGGGYFRLYPYWWTRNCVKRREQREKHPFMFYIHPWEVDPQQPRIYGASRVSRFRHYLNLEKTEKKLDRLLSQFKWGPMTEAVERSYSNRGLVAPLTG